MNVTYVCQECGDGLRQSFDESTKSLECPHCTQQIAIAPGAIEGTRIKRCLVCPSQDLFIRKDFPQRIGVSLVAVGVIGSSIAWYHAHLGWTFGILFSTALADLGLFLLVGNSLMCYRCSAQYRGVAEMEAHGEFNLDTHERYRQLGARLGA